MAATAIKGSLHDVPPPGSQQTGVAIPLPAPVHHGATWAPAAATRATPHEPIQTPSLKSKFYGPGANRPAQQWYGDDRFERTGYSHPDQTNATLHCTRTTEWLLTGDGILNPRVFPGLPAAQGEVRIRLATWNTMDETAGHADANPNDDNTDMRTTDLARIAKGAQIQALFSQEANIKTVRKFVREGFKVVGEYADGSGGVQDKYAVKGWTFLPRHTTPWDMTDARSQESASYWWFTRPLHSLGNSKLWWTGQAFYMDPNRYTMDEQSGSWFKVYSNSAQRTWPTSLKLLGKTIWNGITGRFAAAAAAWNDTRNSVSGLARTDGMLLVKVYDKELKQHVYFAQTHLESFDVPKRARQREEFLDELHKLAMLNPDMFIYVGADLNSPVSDEIGLGDFLGTFHFNPNFADGRGVVAPRVDSRETFFAEHEIDFAGCILPRGYELKNAAGQVLVSSADPGRPEQANDPSITDHCLKTMEAIVVPRARREWTV